MRTSTALAAAALLAGHVTAKTDIAGCVSSQTVAYGGASLIWYVPDTGEICEFLDCGGGRAPPKTTVPGCIGYEGTATYSPRYLSGFGAATSTASSSASEAVTTEATSSGSASVSTSASTSQNASITSPPVTTLTGTATSKPGSESTAVPSSSDSSSGGSTDQPTSGVSTGAAALPTAAGRGGLGVIAGLAAGVAML
jgi:hypothetical protein